MAKNVKFNRITKCTFMTHTTLKSYVFRFLYVDKGPVHMGKSYPGWRENIFTSLPARSHLLTKLNSMERYITFISDMYTEISLLLGEISLHGKIFVPYEHSLFNAFPLSGKTVLYMNRVEMFSC